MRRTTPLLLSLLLASLLPGHALADHAITMASGAMGCTSADDFGGPLPSASLITTAHERGDLTITATHTNVNSLVPCLGAISFVGFAVKGLNPQGTVTETQSLPCAAAIGAPCVPSLTLRWDVPFRLVECSPTGLCGISGRVTASVEIYFQYVVDNVAVGEQGTITLAAPVPDITQ